MTSLRILVCEGNTPADRAPIAQHAGMEPSQHIARLLERCSPDVTTDIAFPADRSPTYAMPLDAYDGIVFTGSKLNIHKQEPATLQQIDLARAAFESGTPMFGVCWGLQLATVAAGGDVQSNRQPSISCEVPFAPQIALTSEGMDHPLHRSRPPEFDAFAFHSDEVVRLPANSVVTARNKSFVQGAVIKGTKSTFWGVQYHPELSGAVMAAYLRARSDGAALCRIFGSEAAIDQAAEELATLEVGAATPRATLTRFPSINTDTFELRPLEIMNWIEHQVIPAKQARRT